MTTVNIETLKRVSSENAAELRRLAGLHRVRGCAQARESIRLATAAAWRAGEIEMARAVRDDQPDYLIGRDGRLYGWMRNNARGGAGGYDFTLLADRA